MCFQDKILAIRPGDRVLEIGPGATPHPRSDVFLELAFESVEVRLAQRGGSELDADFSHRPVFHYDGHRFPFDDGEFDYVICSHVVEHVDEPQAFLQEVFRVGRGRGYLEYPLITYEYLYSFTVHQHFVKFDSDRRVLMFMPKRSSPLDTFAPVQRLFYQSLALGWDDLCSVHKHLFFEGFEFERPFAVHLALRLEDLCPSLEVIKPKRPLRSLLGGLANKVGI